MDGHSVELRALPTKGIKYPKDIEIYVKPLTIKEQIDMSRYGISQAEYFQILLDGITIKGGFDKTNLYYHDVQFLDIVRRLFTFNRDESIKVTDYPCMYKDCDGLVEYSFNFEQVNYTELSEDVFGKVYTFSDGLEVVTCPVTIKEFVKMCRKYLSGKDVSASDIYIAYFIHSIVETKDREFADRDARDKFLYEYIGGLYRNEDRKILDEIEESTVSVVEPFVVTCPVCGRHTEVVVGPTAQFQQ